MAREPALAPSLARLGSEVRAETHALQSLHPEILLDPCTGPLLDSYPRAASRLWGPVRIGKKCLIVMKRPDLPGFARPGVVMNRHGSPIEQNFHEARGLMAGVAPEQRRTR